MTSAERDRFEKCLALAMRGATPGERAAAKAAAERIAASAGMTLAKATDQQRHARTNTSSSIWPSGWSQGGTQPQRSYPRPKPMTVQDMLRQKAEIEAHRRRSAAAADRRQRKEYAKQSAYEAEQRELQAERDREWAARRGGLAP